MCQVELEDESIWIDLKHLPRACCKVFTACARFFYV